MCSEKCISLIVLIPMVAGSVFLLVTGAVSFIERNNRDNGYNSNRITGWNHPVASNIRALTMIGIGSFLMFLLFPVAVILFKYRQVAVAPKCWRCPAMRMERGEVQLTPTSVPKKSNQAIQRERVKAALKNFFIMWFNVFQLRMRVAME